MKHNWREAASLILTVFNPKCAGGGWNYSLLTLERSSKSSFMPNGIVFPGGNTHPSDGSDKWLGIFSDFIINSSSPQNLKWIPPIIENNKGSIPKLLSLKITAIRETLEETGIALCCKNNQLTVSSGEWVTCSVFDGIKEWRRRIQNDPAEFINFCKAKNCCPDVQSLYLWSNWLTPTTMGAKRFDTLFFIAFAKELPFAMADKTEVETLGWQQPDDLVRLSKGNKIYLPPPQFYETSRLLHFRDVNALREFSQERSASGCPRWMPEQVVAADGNVTILPGDGAFREMDQCATAEPARVDVTIEEFRSQSNVLHRMEFRKQGESKVVTKGYKPDADHILPIDLSS